MSEDCPLCAAGVRTGMSELQRFVSIDPLLAPLPWTGGWRKVYAQAAAACGYICEWSGGLSISKVVEGRVRYLSIVTPKERTFLMADLCKQADEEWLKRNADRIRERAEQDELNAEAHSRMAAGEASLLIRKFRVVEEERRSRELPIAAAVLGAFSYYPMPRCNWTPISRYRAPHRRS